MLIIDILGVVWGLYPFYLIVILGFFSVAIHFGDNLEDGLEEEDEVEYELEY
jgi:hypothetical protein